MTGSWDSVLYFLNGRGGGQSEHERGREGGKDGPFNQHTDALSMLKFINSLTTSRFIIIEHMIYINAVSVETCCIRIIYVVSAPI